VLINLINRRQSLDSGITAGSVDGNRIDQRRYDSRSCRASL